MHLPGCVLGRELKMPVPRGRNMLGIRKHTYYIVLELGCWWVLLVVFGSWKKLFHAIVILLTNFLFCHSYI